jgi:hypothetical protein
MHIKNVKKSENRYSVKGVVRKSCFYYRLLHLNNYHLLLSVLTRPLIRQK